MDKPNSSVSTKAKEYPDCGAEISSNALSCPMCGSSEINKAIKAGAKAYLGCWAAIIGFIAVLAAIERLTKLQKNYEGNHLKYK